MTIVGAQIWRGCDILARSQPAAWTPCILSFFSVCQHFQTWLPVETHRQRGSLLGMPGSSRLYYVFNMPWIFSQQPKLLQTGTSSPRSKSCWYRGCPKQMCCCDTIPVPSVLHTQKKIKGRFNALELTLYINMIYCRSQYIYPVPLLNKESFILLYFIFIWEMSASLNRL